MNEIELLENLLETSQKISYDNKEEFELLEKRTQMLIKKIFWRSKSLFERPSFYPLFTIDIICGNRA